MTDLITLYTRLHANNRRYGAGGTQYLREILAFAARLLRPCSPPPRILDFGCGKGGLCDCLRPHGFEVVGYDPALEGFSVWPAARTFDLVVCTDVLEHIPEERHAGAPLARACYLMRSTGAAAFFVAVHCGPAATILADGTNAHKTVRPPNWWLEYLTGRLCDECILTRNRPPIAVFHGFNRPQIGADGGET